MLQELHCPGIAKLRRNDVDIALPYPRRYLVTKLRFPNVGIKLLELRRPKVAELLRDDVDITYSFPRRHYVTKLRYRDVGIKLQ